MPSFFSILSALAAATTAVALPTTHERSAPNLPDGFFAGFNNPDGTATLQFPETNKKFTFDPTEAPESAGLQKRDGQAYCWNGLLGTQAVDTGMFQLRERLAQSPIGLGQYSDWPAYFGYNNNGVYVYFCVNIGGDNHFSFTRQDYNEMSLFMDQRCGAYRDGYVSHGLYGWALFGKARSGTRVCAGNPRTP